MSKSEKRSGIKFSVREIRAVLLMLPLVAVAVWIVSLAVRPRFDDSAAVLGDSIAGNAVSVSGQVDAADSDIALRLFAFDPNEVTYEQLRLLGMDKKTAAGIVRYRAAGKVFRIAEDFATCYGVTDSMYAALKPYIDIGDEYAVSGSEYSLQKKAGGNHERVGRVAVVETFDPNALKAEGFVNLGFSPKQAQVIINFRNRIGGFGNADDFAKCYVVSDEMFSRLRGYMVFSGSGELSTSVNAHRIRSDIKAAAPVDINSADSAQLVSVRGIGPKTASAIIAYRNRLGGFCRTAQICETGVVTERNWEIIREQISVDSCAIQKIDINFAAPNTIAKHPYIGGKTLRKLLSNRQLKGGWSTIEDMLNDNTLTVEEMRKLTPYLQFRVQNR